MSDNALPPFVRQIIEELEPWRMLSPEECARLTAWIETLHPRIREYAEDLGPGAPALSRTWVSMALAMIPNGNLLAEAYLTIRKRLAYQEAITKWESDTPAPQKIDTPLTPLQQDILRALDGQALKKEKLAEKLKIDPARLYRNGGIKELVTKGLVCHKEGVGYYRPDAPPRQAAAP